MEIIGFAREMMKSPVELLEGVRDAVEELSKSYDLMIITKGDLFDQESKIARSGLGDYFGRVEIVSEKDRRMYEAVIRRHAIAPERFLMVGNSIRSDILPVVEAGARAVYVPYPTTWFHEGLADYDPEKVQFFQIESLGDLPAFLKGFTPG
jgi:putative hydrolase of the HAD superfamily